MSSLHARRRKVRTGVQTFTMLPAAASSPGNRSLLLAKHVLCVISREGFNQMGSHHQFRGILIACLVIARLVEDLFTMRDHIVVQSLLCLSGRCYVL